MTPSPDPRTTANVAELLAAMAPDAAGDAIAMIMDAIRDGLVRDHWPPLEAEMFSVRFGREVAELLHEMVRPDDAVLH